MLSPIVRNVPEYRLLHTCCNNTIRTQMSDSSNLVEWHIKRHVWSSCIWYTCKKQFLTAITILTSSMLAPFLHHRLQGTVCDECKPGTFGIDMDYPLGCYSCFCFPTNGIHKCSRLEGFRLVEDGKNRGLEVSLVFLTTLFAIDKTVFLANVCKVKD